MSSSNKDITDQSGNDTLTALGGDTTATSTSASLSERYATAIALVEASPEQCLAQLEALRRDMDALSLFSKDDTLDEVSTKSLPFLSLDHFVAMALVNVPTGPGQAMMRKSNVKQAITLWGHFLERLGMLEEVLTKEEVKEFHDLLDVQQHYYNSTDGGDADTTTSILHAPGVGGGPYSRDVKIARFKAKQQQQQELQRLQALWERRKRCGMEEQEELDGHDHDSLQRTVALSQLQIHKVDALENWSQSLRELPMIERMVQMEAEQVQRLKHTTGGGGNGSAAADTDGRLLQQATKSGLQVTHITKDTASGQLLFQREEIRSKVFRPGWSQPTMSLEEFGEREYQQAIEREERQKQAEAQQKNEPRRYEELVRDGMEDDVRLVEASAALDREWDDWKDANPRGSGNKMANRGDKNF